MESVTLDVSVARNLIETNLAVIRKDIRRILKKWKVTAAKEMIESVENGRLPEAEIDAISLTNLIDKQTELEEMYARIGDQGSEQQKISTKRVT